MVEQRYSCAEYRNYLVYDGSWINNQARGTSARMRDKGGVLRYSTPGAPSQDDVAPWNWVGSIHPDPRHGHHQHERVAVLLGTRRRQGLRIGDVDQRDPIRPSTCSAPGRRAPPSRRSPGW